MGPHTSLTPKIFKLKCPFRVHAGAFIYQLSHQNMFAMSLMIFGVPYYEP